MVKSDPGISFGHEVLSDFLKELFRLYGGSNHTCETVVNGLIYASLRGIDSHGIRLVPHYIKSALAGRKNPDPSFATKRDGAVLKVDADHGFGLAAGAFAIEEGVKIATDHGICFVIVRNSTHPAAISATTSLCVSRGFASIGMANADSLMRSTNARNSFFGTNPISFAAPGAHEKTFCVDLATTSFTWNKVKMYREENRLLPVGVAADQFGSETTDPHAARMLIPMGEHKGFALAAMVEVLTSCISGGPSATEISSMYDSPLDVKRNLSQVYIVFSAKLFGDSAGYVAKMNSLDRLLQAESDAESEQQVVLPGALEERTEEERRKTGIPVEFSLLDSLNRLMSERDGSQKLHH